MTRAYRAGLGLIAACLCGASLAAHALAQASRERLEGWGPFRFSMSLAEATAAVGGKATVEHGTILYPIEIEGRPYRAVVNFAGSGQRIAQIEIDSDPKWRSAINRRETCNEAGERLAAAIARRYGPYGDVVESGPAALRVKRWIFAFADGAQIQATASFAPRAAAGHPAGCAAAAFYEPPTRSPRRP